MQFVDNGMFALSMNNPLDVDSDDDDDEVLGAATAEGMPPVRKNFHSNQAVHGKVRLGRISLLTPDLLAT